MKNKHVGYLVSVIGFVIILIILIFNLGMKSIIDSSCSHGSSCSMYGTIKIQTGFSFVIAGLVFAIGLFLIFSKETEKIIIKTKKIKDNKKISLEGLSKKERKAVEIIKEGNGVFQADLREKLEIGKVGMTRLLDKLEAKQIIERKRRGMNNFIVIRR